MRCPTHSPYPPCSATECSPSHPASEVIQSIALLPPAPSGAVRAALACEDKRLSVVAWGGGAAASALRVESSTLLAKKPTGMVLLPQAVTAEGGRALVVADKVGDATAYPLPGVGSSRRWLLGHCTSILTAVESAVLEGGLGSGDGGRQLESGGVGRQLLFTGDRDEAIRVTELPHV